jgi:hypothetical protein
MLKIAKSIHNLSINQYYAAFMAKYGDAAFN